MITTNTGIEWGLDIDINNAGDLVFILHALKLDENDEVLFSKEITSAVLQHIVTNADSLTPAKKQQIVTALDNFRDNLLS